MAVVCCILNHMCKVNPPAATGQPANFREPDDDVPLRR